MSIDITMPALSPTMEEGNLAKWLVKEGDTVSAGDVIAEIETDKATMEVEAVDEGVVAKILVAEGTEGVKVNAVIAVLAEDGEDAGSVEAGAPQAEAKPAEGSQAEEKPESATVAMSVPKAAKPEGAPALSVALPDTNAAPSGSFIGNGQRVFATPLARRIASQNNIEIASLSGSGPHGRIIKADVEAAIGSGAGTGAGASGSLGPPMSSGMADSTVLGLFEADQIEKKPTTACAA